MSQTSILQKLAGAAITLGAVGSVFAADQGTAWTGSADEVRALVSEVMADAETRSSLLAAGSAAGYDNSRHTFFLASDDGSWRLNIGGYVQFRYFLDFRDDNGGDEDFESGFDSSRTEVIFDGHVATNVFYKIEGNFVPAGGAFTLQDAYGGYRWDNGLYVKFGQFKLPYLREELVGDTMQLTVDRSLTNFTFSQGRSQGVELGYEQEDWRVMAAFSDGLNSQNSLVGTNSPFSFNDGFTRGGGESDWAITGRFEWKAAGSWDQFKDFTSMPGNEFALLLGVAGTVEQSDNNIPGGVGPGPDRAFGTADDVAGVGGDTTLGGWTADLSIEGDGWNFYAAAIGHHVSNNLAGAGGPANSSYDDYGFVVQGGIFIPNTDWEIFGRYDVAVNDSDRTGAGGAAPGIVAGADDNFNTVTFGANWYWSGHAAKFTVDCQWFLDSANTLNGPVNSIGYFQDLSDENEISVRFQFQFVF
ncbi:MAG TPA: porin [Phycisphaerales bacterium]|nr:porin [Phycisphaerales bacterium]